MNDRAAVLADAALTRLERPSDDVWIEALQRAAFGPGAYARAAFRVREQAAHDPSLSFVTERAGMLIGSVRMTAVTVGAGSGSSAVSDGGRAEGRGGLLLGPLVVDPACRKLGYGKALMRTAVEAARRAGRPFVLLVGDAPYYWPFGFRRAPSAIRMPGPVDPARMLVAELAPGSAADLSGLVRGVAAPPADSV